MRQRLNRLIEWQGIKQSEIARRLRVSEGWVSRRLTGTSDILSDEIERFAEALHINPCALVDDIELQGATRPSRPRMRVAESGPPYGDVVARELARDWDDLPEAEREFLVGLAEIRRRYRERTGAPNIR